MLHGVLVGLGTASNDDRLARPQGVADRSDGQNAGLLRHLVKPIKNGHDQPRGQQPIDKSKTHQGADEEGVVDWEPISQPLVQVLAGWIPGCQWDDHGNGAALNAVSQQVEDQADHQHRFALSWPPRARPGDVLGSGSGSPASWLPPPTRSPGLLAHSARDAGIGHPAPLIARVTRTSQSSASEASAAFHDTGSGYGSFRRRTAASAAHCSPNHRKPIGELGQSLILYFSIGLTGIAIHGPGQPEDWHAKGHRDQDGECAALKVMITPIQR